MQYLKMMNIQSLQYNQYHRSTSILQQATRQFSTPGGPPPGGSQNNNNGNDGYVSDEEGGDFDSDRRFSNFILFGGFLALGGILMASNVVHLQKK